jgi:LacI family transcriptional regulator
MTSFLIKSGYKKIAFISGLPENSESSSRIGGYKQALKENKIKFDEKLLKTNCYDDQDGYLKMQEFFNQSSFPEVVFAANDMVAIGVIKAIREKGLDIPNDIGVAGYGNMKYGEVLSPPLTTVNQPKYKMGSEAARILISKIEGEQTKVQQINLPTKLIIRESTKI